MAILKIARMGHPVLRRTAAVVADPAARELARLVADMVETMHDASGLGLAAPQVHLPLRVVVFHVPERRAGNPEAASGSADGPVPLTVLINPEIEPLTDERSDGWEACLSLPGLAGYVSRCSRIRYRATGLDGATVDRVAEGFHARVVQHECDHLDGTLYPQRMRDLALLGFADEIKRFPPLAPPPEESG
jgi:peptide deformylase